jgi:hypothetical protein
LIRQEKKLLLTYDKKPHSQLMLAHPDAVELLLNLLEGYFSEWGGQEHLKEKAVADIIN